MDEYLSTGAGEYDFSQENEAGLKIVDIIPYYDDDFFLGHSLILIFKEENSISVRHELQSVEVDHEHKQVNIDILLDSPEIRLPAMGGWHHVIPVEKVADDYTVNVNWSRAGLGGPIIK